MQSIPLLMNALVDGFQELPSSSIALMRPDQGMLGSALNSPHPTSFSEVMGAVIKIQTDGNPAAAQEVSLERLAVDENTIHSMEALLLDQLSITRPISKSFPVPELIPNDFEVFSNSEAGGLSNLDIAKTCPSHGFLGEISDIRSDAFFDSGQWRKLDSRLPETAAVCVSQSNHTNASPTVLHRVAGASLTHLPRFSEPVLGTCVTQTFIEGSCRDSEDVSPAESRSSNQTSENLIGYGGTIAQETSVCAAMNLRGTFVTTSDASDNSSLTAFTTNGGMSHDLGGARSWTRFAKQSDVSGLKNFSATGREVETQVVSSVSQEVKEVRPQMGHDELAFDSTSKANAILTPTIQDGWSIPSAPAGYAIEGLIRDTSSLLDEVEQTSGRQNIPPAVESNSWNSELLAELTPVRLTQPATLKTYFAALPLDGDTSVAVATTTLILETGAESSVGGLEPLQSNNDVEAKETVTSALADTNGVRLTDQFDTLRIAGTDVAKPQLGMIQRSHNSDSIRVKQNFSSNRWESVDETSRVTHASQIPYWQQLDSELQEELRPVEMVRDESEFDRSSLEMLQPARISESEIVSKSGLEVFGDSSLKCLVEPHSNAGIGETLKSNQSAAVASENSPRMSPNQALDNSDYLERLLVREVSVRRHDLEGGQEPMVILMNPDEKTTLRIEVRKSNHLLTAQVIMERGNSQGLEREWASLKSKLEVHGVRLDSLVDQSHNGFSNSNMSNSDRGSRGGGEWRRFVEEESIETFRFQREIEKRLNSQRISRSTNSDLDRSLEMWA